MSEIIIRAGSSKDAFSISVVHANSWKKAYQGLLSEEYLNNIKDTEWVNMITKGLEDNTMKAWVATIDNKIIACTCIGDSRYEKYKGQLELISIYVLLQYWNLRVGSLLINKVLEYGFNNNYLEIGLWVLDGNEKAIRFYEKFGFINNGDTTSCMLGKNFATEKRYIKNLV